MLPKGKPTLVLPGLGGYTATWAPGVKIIPLQEAPAGHSVIPCDMFNSSKSTSSHDITFTTDHAIETTSTETAQRS